MDIKAKLEALISDVEAIYHEVEEAISAHNGGTLTPNHLEAVRDSAAAAKENAQALVAVPQGSPVPDTGTGAPDAMQTQAAPATGAAGSGTSATGADAAKS